VPAVIEGGRRIKAWVFVAVLSYSRLLYAELVRDQSVATWLGCHRRAAQGVIRLADKHGAKALNAACERALAFGFSDYKTAKGILKNGAIGLNEAFDFEPAGEAYQGRGRFSPTHH